MPGQIVSLGRIPPERMLKEHEKVDFTHVGHSTPMNPKARACVT
jgi:hypothetical protein